jgi:carbon monoxide dehydrogenase subunit G
MQMTGQRVLPVPPRQAWDALNDPEMLKACIPGCESITLTEPQRYELAMAARIGPVSARFKGRLEQSDVIEPESYSIRFDGQGGAAGFGKGSANVRLVPVDEGTRLEYDVTAQVGGKLAQIGSRLVDGAARKIADDFFAGFETRLRERVATEAAAAGAPAAAAEPVGGGTPGGAGEAAQGALASAPGAAPGPAPATTPGSFPEGADRSRWLAWAIAFAIAVAVIVWMSR